MNISLRSQWVPSAISTNTSLLANHLSRKAKSDLQKVRAFYVWITSNIKYDQKSFQKSEYPDQSPGVVITRRTALCQGYADLFQALCNEVGIKTHVIAGYSKGYGYTPGKAFETSDHAWNAVKIEDKWYLLDATWGSTPSDANSFREKYFLTSPDLFVIDHLPTDPIWQFLNPPVPLEIFEKETEEIQDYILSSTERFNYLDSLQAWETKGLSQAMIDSHRRSISFNPGNKRAVFRLGTELLFKALELMDDIHQVNYDGFADRVSEMQKDMFEALDEAAFHFTNVPDNTPEYEKAVVLAEEVTFQKGVFFYEVGQRVYDLFLEMNEGQFLSNHKEGIQLINIYYTQSINYFNLVEKDSPYYEDARNYLDFYLTRNPLVPEN